MMPSIRVRLIQAGSLLAFALFLAHQFGWNDRFPAWVSPVARWLWLLPVVFLAGRLIPAVIRSKREHGWNRRIRLVAFAIAPPHIARMIIAELLTWKTLFDAVARRSERRQQTSFAYHRSSLIMAWLTVLLVSSPAEILLVEVLVPWAPVRVALLLICVYSVLWFVGYAVAHVIYPHVLDDNGIVVRKANLASARIPFAAIARLTICRSPADAGKDAWGIDRRRDDAVVLGIEGKANVRVDLLMPVTVVTLTDDIPAVRTLYMWFDKPMDFATTLERYDVLVDISETPFIVPDQLTDPKRKTVENLLAPVAA